MKIPLVAWKAMRQHTILPEEHYLDLSDAELRHQAELEVENHRKELASQPDSSFNGFFGSLVFGPPKLSREEMIEHFVRHYRPAPLEGQA